jgi:N-acetylglucosamine malate deacetylase 1
MVDKILIIAAHPDDEVLGVGGTIAKYASLGADVYVAILCSQASKRRVVENNNLDVPLEVSLKKALVCLGVPLDNLYCYNFPNLKMNSIPHDQLVTSIENLILSVEPDKIFLHYENDLNIDHQVIAQACSVAIRIFERRNLPHVIKMIAQYEIPSSTNWQIVGPRFIPNMYVDITDTFQKKIYALKYYEQSLKTIPNPLSLDYVSALATIRGSEAGLIKAEAFKVIKAIEK